MDNIGKHENMSEYAEEYFKLNENLKSNFCAITNETLLEKFKRVPLKQRLQWVVRSEHKEVHLDPFQFNLFSSFNSDELATVLLTYHQDDKDRLVNAKFYSKMPSKTMKSLFLRNDAMDCVEDRDIEMLAQEYSISHPYTIFEIMTHNYETLNKKLFNELYKKLPTENQMDYIDDISGEKMSFLQSMYYHIESKGR